MSGERPYRVVYDVFAQFPCNCCGVRVGVRRSIEGARRYAEQFGKRNRAETSTRLRLEYR